MKPKLFRNKYRIESTRLKGYDYRNKGAYFITICTHNRNYYLGECCNGEMQLNDIGILAHQFWLEIPNHFPNVSLGEFVVMPNHIHGIIVINEKIEMERLVARSVVETQNFASLQPTEPATEQSDLKLGIPKNQFFQNLGAPAKSISTMIRAYKAAVTQHARIMNCHFGWQSRFHDHIVRSQSELDRIENYIRNNPRNWKDDRFFR